MIFKWVLINHLFMSPIEGLREEEMPRERLIKNGPESLTDVELLAIILRVGTKGKNVLELSREIIDFFSTQIVSRKSYDELLEFNGIKKAKACQIVAIFELSRRLASRGIENSPIIGGSNDLFEIVKDDFNNLAIERVMVVFVNSKNKVLRKEFVSEGSISFSVVEPRAILKRAFSLNASGFFLVHNHPSGDFTPSYEDIEISLKMKRICKDLDLRFLDHVVVGDGYYSMFDNDVL